MIMDRDNLVVFFAALKAAFDGWQSIGVVASGQQAELVLHHSFDATCLVTNRPDLSVVS